MVIIAGKTSIRFGNGPDFLQGIPYEVPMWRMSVTKIELNLPTSFCKTKESYIMFSLALKFLLVIWPPFNRHCMDKEVS